MNPYSSVRFIACVLALTASPLWAQGVPDTDVFVADLRLENGRLAVGEPVNVTARPGYDNQPWFLPNGRSLYYVSQRDGQTDVYQYDLGRRTSRQVTATPESEYSPALTPDRKNILTVRVEADSSQHLWLLSRDGRPLRRAPGDVTGVGYYAWPNPRTLALFIADSVQSFVLSDARTGRTTPVGSRLGGSPPRAIPGRNAVSFLQQDSTGAWWIHQLDVATRQSRPLVRAVPGSVHYTWTRRGTILMALGATLYEWDPARGPEWQEIAKFSDPGLQAITRIALSPRGDRIALVSASTPTPAR